LSYVGQVAKVLLQANPPLPNILHRQISGPSSHLDPGFRRDDDLWTLPVFHVVIWHPISDLRHLALFAAGNGAVARPPGTRSQVFIRV